MFELPGGLATQQSLDDPLVLFLMYRTS
jgi:hypothetical protein